LAEKKSILPGATSNWGRTWKNSGQQRTIFPRNHKSA